MRSESHGRAFFAEFAEALGINTDQIMAAIGHSGRFAVAYTPELDGDDLDPGTPLIVAWLDRGEGGIFRVVGQRLVEVDWSDFQASIERTLKERLDSPPEPTP